MVEGFLSQSMNGGGSLNQCVSVGGEPKIVYGWWLGLLVSVRVVMRAFSQSKSVYAWYGSSISHVWLEVGAS